jgi:hypothetical protein
LVAQHNADDSGNAGDKQQGEQQAADDKGKGTDMMEVALPIFVTLYTKTSR